jgi:hypothetical protein
MKKSISIGGMTSWSAPHERRGENWIVCPLSIVLTAEGGYHRYEYGQPHREEGPACLWPDGTQRWHRRGGIHRNDERRPMLNPDPGRHDEGWPR